MSFDKLYTKYATKSPIRPPAPEEEVGLDIPDLGAPPVIKELSEQEMLNWEDFISAEKRSKERMKDYLGKEEKLDKEEGTIPAIPGKKANLSPDTLLKMCSQYHDLCRKL